MFLINFPGDDEAYQSYRILGLMKKQSDSGSTEGLVGLESNNYLMIVKEAPINVQNANMEFGDPLI